MPGPAWTFSSPVAGRRRPRSPAGAQRSTRLAARPSLGLHTTWDLPVPLFAEVGYLFGQVAVDDQLADTITRHPVDTSINAWDVRLGLHVNL